MGKQKLYMISLDAFGSKDLDYAKTLPNFNYLLKKSALVKNVETVYPSLTYMCHTSILTGLYPHKHGITHNTKLQPSKSSPDWFWYAQDIQSSTIFDIAHENGWNVASFLWPVTGKSRSIDYNLTEIFPNRSWQNQVMVSLYSGSPFFVYQLDKKFGKLRNGIMQPELDEFLTAGIIDTIKTKNPDLMAIHFVDLDYMRHHHGVDSKQAKAAIQRMDQHLGQIIRAMKQQGIFDETILAIFGDHYQIDTHTAIRLNVLFRQEGWIEVDKNGHVKKWKVIAQPAEGSCYIYSNGEVSDQSIFELLQLYPDCIEVIYNQEQANALGADPDCTFLIEAKRGFYFLPENNKPFMETVKEKNSLYKATHGYSPTKDNYETFLMMSGPTINTGMVIEQARLVDEGPTFLHALGLSFPTSTDGKILFDLFENQ
ncbi:alkaline phosphatase family protein [Lacticigenium naphthae]|uniref:alkaline phosphatase family protein n=1 Tax=Lacticigenium naphthae TaxID=515351 RepID=UPI00040F06AC|nr:ectonucleotide pyrophosphatase/phosphodiesterase [Lacticigenium naphthae]